MSQFVVKYSLPSLMKKRKFKAQDTETFDRSSIVVGSRPFSDVYVRDRLVAKSAARISIAGAALQLEVLEPLAGVFVDGSPVEGRGPIREGSKVQIGHTLIEVKKHVGDQVELEVTEFHQPGWVADVNKREKPEEELHLADPGPQEHTWGRSRIMSRANFAALAVGGLLVLAFPFMTNSEALTRGELASFHQIGADHPDGSPQSCADCHSPFSSDYEPTCAECHPGFEVRPDAHPYVKSEESECQFCHMDHRGADAELIPAASIEPGGLCLECHGIQDIQRDDFQWTDAKLAEYQQQLGDEPGEPFDRILDVDGFSHADHRIVQPSPRTSRAGPDTEGQIPIACAECHQSLQDNPSGAELLVERNPAADFGAVTYEQCLDCHAEWKVEVHGRDEEGRACYQCHAPKPRPEDITAELRPADLVQTNLEWTLRPRQHDYSADQCLDCHVLDKSEVEEGKTRIAVFRHDHHLPELMPDPAQRLLASESCKQCHASVAASTTLVGTELVDVTWGDGQGCVTCHTDSVPERVRVPGTEMRQVVDMFHAVHTIDLSVSEGALRSRSMRETLSDGCYACHVPQPGTDRMTFVPETKNCMECHSGHENVGENKCVICHIDREHEGNRDAQGRVIFRFNEAGIFNREKATTKTTARIEDFDHFSPGHLDHDCADCHDTQAVDETERVADVPWPAHDEASCIKCHMRTRYHR